MHWTLPDLLALPADVYAELRTWVSESRED